MGIVLIGVDEELSQLLAHCSQHALSIRLLLLEITQDALSVRVLKTKFLECVIEARLKSCEAVARLLALYPYVVPCSKLIIILEVVRGSTIFAIPIHDHKIKMLYIGVMG